MDIAWRGEAYVLAEGTVFIATAPYFQHVAALDIFPPAAFVPLGGETTLQDGYGGRTTLTHYSLRMPIFECIEVKPAVENGGFRSVLLRCAFDARIGPVYMKRVAALGAASRFNSPLEAGFIATSGISASAESSLCRALPRGPIPVSDFKAALARAAHEVASGSCSDPRL
jgi:hypothetical protein